MPTLSAVRHNHQLQFSEPVVPMGCHCPMHTVLAMLRKIRGVSSLVVGMPECGCYSRLVIDETFQDDQTKHYTYILSSKEVIFGCADGVASAIDQMADEGAERLIVLKTCTPALIGETLDYEGPMPVAVLDLAHFKTNGYMSGFNLLLEALSQFMERKQSPKRIVNFIGNTSSGEVDLWIGFIEAHGYHCNKISGSIHFNTLEMLSHGALNICLSYEWHGLCAGLDWRMNVPYVNLFDCYEPSQYQKCVKNVETLLQIDGFVLFLQESFEGVNARWQSLVERASKGKRKNINLANQDVQAIAFAIALYHLGYEVKHIHIEQWDEVCQKWRPELLALGLDPMAHYMTSEGPFGVRGWAGELLNRDQCLELQSLIGLERIEYLMNVVEKTEAV